MRVVKSSLARFDSKAVVRCVASSKKVCGVVYGKEMGSSVVEKCYLYCVVNGKKMLIIILWVRKDSLWCDERDRNRF